MLNCKKCKQYTESRVQLDYTNFTSGVGNKSADVMVVLDFPVIEDISSGGFLSNSMFKRILIKLMAKLEYTLDDIYVTSLIKCRPADTTKKPNKTYITKCTKLYLYEEIKEVKPKVIITIGKYSAATLVKGLKTLAQSVGSVFINSDFNVQVIPWYNLTYIQKLNKQSVPYKNSIKAVLEVRKALTTENKKDDIYISKDVKDLDKLGEEVGVDLETSKLCHKTGRVLTLSISDISTTVSFDDGTGGIPYKEIYECLLKRKLIYQNGTFDYKFHKDLGHKKLLFQLLMDTRNLQYLLEPDGTNSLDFMAQMYYGVDLKSGIDQENMLDEEPEDRRIYCGYDAYYTMKIYKEKLLPKIIELGMIKSAKVRSLATIVVTELEYNGIGFDTYKAKVIKDELEKEKFLILEKFKKTFKLSDEFNLNSPDQLRKLFYSDLGLPIKVWTNRKKEKGSTNEKALTGLIKQRKTLQQLLDYREKKGELEKVNGYIKATEDDGRIYSSYNLFSPKSLRMMSAKPNVQNPARESLIKGAFVPKEGYSYVYFDFGSLEFRCWCHVANDPVGIKFLNEENDIHYFIASKINGKPESKITKDERQDVKDCVYSMIFGNDAHGVAYNKEIDEQLAKDVYRIFFQLCKVGKQWINNTERLVQRQGWVATPFGARRFFPDIKTKKGYFLRHALNEALSFPIQSWGNELGVISSYKCLCAISKNKVDAKVIHNQHDSYIFETLDADVEKMKLIINKCAANPIKMRVPLPVDIKVGKSWAELG